MSPKKTKTILAATAIAGLGGAATLLSISPADAAPVTETFEFTGASEDFVVPEGVCSLTVDAFGAEGGVASDGNVAGLGGRATAVVEVTPGETLVVTVGGQGGDGRQDESAAEGSVSGLGGFNGGGNGGDDGNQDPGGGGGGASDVRQGGSGLGDRVVVAGGGGGSGGDTTEEDAPDDGTLTPTPEGEPPANRGSGGSGGGTEGTPGQDSGFDSGGGGGGTQSAGGAAGTPDPTTTAGSAGQGGNGGTGDSGKGGPNDGGGGGGGGWFGGGGGSGDVFIDDVTSPAEGGLSTSDGGGGGGGSGFGPAGVTFETGVQPGDGVVEITYDTAGETCEPDVLPDDTTPPVIAGEPAFTG